MCGRFTLTELQPDVLIARFDLRGDLPPLAPRYNIAPTQPVAIVRRETSDSPNRLAIVRWGLVPAWAQDPRLGSRLINARAESLHEKPSFRAAFRRRRCLVLADGFYEWQALPDGGKQPIFITLVERGPFAFAGLWERWSDPHSGGELETCTIITTAPNALLAPIHTRMPAILPREHYALWLDPQQTDPGILLPLLAPYPAEALQAWPVSRRVNDPAHDDPELIARAG